MRSVQRLVPTLLVAAGLGACSSDVQQPQISIAAVVSSVTLDGEGTPGSLEQSSLPAEGAAPALNVSWPFAAINGGTFIMSVTSEDAFSELVLGLQSAQDYFKVVLPAPATSANLLVTLSPDVPEGALTLFVVGGTSPTQYGPVMPRSLSVMRVGSGDVQVSVAWNSAADVDLHVIDPSGEELYYGSRTSASGGELDLDSNAACSSDQPRNENTVWPVGDAPTGTYTVRLDYWDSCDALETDYVVTVWVKGREPQVLSGTFTGPGEQGGLGSGIDITTFNR